MRSRAFTLIELLVVMAILGILAAVGLVSFRSSQARGRDAQRKSDLKQIASALELYYSDYGVYPDPSLLPGGGEFTDGKTIYFRVVPEDPAGGQDYYYRRVAVGGASNQGFQLYAHLENSEDKNCLPGTDGKPNCTSPTGVPADASCGLGVCNFAITSPNTTPTE